MLASRSLCALACGLLLAAALLVLSGPAIGRAVENPRAQGPRIAARVAVTGPRAERRRHHKRKHHRPRLRHRKHGPVGGPAARGTAESPAPRLEEAAVTPGAPDGGGSVPAPQPAPPLQTPPPLGGPETPENPVPPVETVARSGCFYSPSACRYPDPTNTGVPAGTALTPSGSLVVKQAGAVVAGVDVTGTIQILADDVTIEDSRVTQTSTCGPTSSCGNYAIAIGPGLAGVRIAHVETRTAPGATCEQDIRNTGSQVTIQAAYMHACDGNVYAVGPTVLEDSYGIAKIEISTDHIENVYFNETSFTATHDTLLNPVNQTAVIFGNSGGGTDVTNCTNQLTVQESLLAGGGYSLYPCAHSSQPGASTLNVLGNHFARCLSTPIYEANGGHHPCSGGADTNGYYPNSGSYGIATDYYSGTGVWRGNVWDDDRSKVCIDGGSRGCE